MKKRKIWTTVAAILAMGAGIFCLTRPLWNRQGRMHRAPLYRV